MTKAWMVMVVALAGSIALADGPVVSVHLPRDTLVSPGPLSLGDICAIHCQDEETSRIAGATSMGRSPFANEKLVFDRPTVLARLVASGLTPDQVHLTGADTVTVECTGSTAAPTCFPAADQAPPHSKACIGAFHQCIQAPAVGNGPLHR